MLVLDSDEIKEVLSGHTRILNEHDDKIHLLEVKSNVYETRFDTVDKSLLRIENAQTTSSTLLLNTLATISLNQSSANQNLALVDKQGTTQITKIKSYNMTRVILKVLGIISAIALAYLSGKGFQVNM